MYFSFESAEQNLFLAPTVKFHVQLHLMEKQEGISTLITFMWLLSSVKNPSVNFQHTAVVERLVARFVCLLTASATASSESSFSE